MDTQTPKHPITQIRKHSNTQTHSKLIAALLLCCFAALLRCGVSAREGHLFFAFEYLASGELRLDPLYGCVNFDDVCFLDARAMRKVSYPPQLDDVLLMWERLDAPEDYTARSVDRLVKQQAGLLPLTKQFGPPDAITVLAPVANRYRGDGIQGCKFANLPRTRREITELMRLACCLRDLFAYASAAQTLSHVLALDPGHPGANYELFP